MATRSTVLITGGAGFIGSHLAESLVAGGSDVVCLDDFSTGRYANLAALDGRPGFRLVVGSVLDRDLVEELVRETDSVYHLASAVGVQLIMDRPVHTIESIFLGTDTVMRSCARYRRPILLTSTSEVYGKTETVPFREDSDRVFGDVQRNRWAYACAKALDEFLLLAHWRETRLPAVIVRLFNTVGPRQQGQYGMVVPRFVQAAMAGETLRVHGDGKQTRSFCHVADVVRALTGLMGARDRSAGQVFNVGSPEEISILALAERVVKACGSASQIETIPYSEAYGDGFEDMRRRVPSIEKIGAAIGWKPSRALDDVIRDVIAHEKAAHAS